jgi:glycosidase
MLKKPLDLSAAGAPMRLARGGPIAKAAKAAKAEKAEKAEKAAPTVKVLEAPASEVEKDDRAGDRFVPGARPTARRPQTSIGALDLEGLAAHVRAQPWFQEGDRTIAALQILGEQELPSSEPGVRNAFVTVKLSFEGGGHERYVVPLRIDGQGAVSDGLASAAFKDSLVAAVAEGARFEPAARVAARPRRSRRGRAPRSGGSGAQGVLGARLAEAQKARQQKGVLGGARYDAKVEAAALARALYDGEKNAWSPLVEKGYTTVARFEHVLEQARTLSADNADALVVEFFKNVYRTLEAQPAAIKAFHEALQSRPRFGPTFYGYAQFMAVPESERGKEKPTSNFDDLGKALDVIGRGPQGALGSMARGGLGFREIEILPFFLSPQKDVGYDITKHDEVAPEVGGNQAHARFMQWAVAGGFRVIADLVGNHVAGDHPWVKAFLAGDESMKSFFVTWDDAVKVGERKIDGRIYNVFLHTKGENAGKISHVWQIFPDNNPDTFIEVEVNGKKQKVFASFMNPYQWDVNAANPAVLSHFLGVIGHFANLGQMGTRMDAIIHLGKRPGTDNINLPESQAFMQLMKAFASHVAPGNLFVPEANLPWKTAKSEWLDAEKVIDGKVENTSGDALISFDVHKAIWESLLKGGKKAWLDAQKNVGDLPAHKSILVYLGLHDETLIDDPVLRKQLVDSGAHEFAGRGVGDSPAALLGGDADRLAMAHVLLYSSKGHPAVYYRTVVGSPNDEKYFKKNIDERLEAQKAAGQKPDVAKSTDTRDLDRGPVFLADYEKALAEGYKPAVTIRALNALWDKHGAVRTNDIEEVPNQDDGVVSFARRSSDADDPPLLQLINLTGEKKTVVLDVKDLDARLGWSGLEGAALRDLLQGEIDGTERPMPFTVADGKVTLTLAPYEGVYLERKDG